MEDKATDVGEAGRGWSYGVSCKLQDVGIAVAGGETRDGVAGEQCLKDEDGEADEAARSEGDGGDDAVKGYSS